MIKFLRFIAVAALVMILTACLREDLSPKATILFSVDPTAEIVESGDTASLARAIERSIAYFESRSSSDRLTLNGLSVTVGMYRAALIELHHFLLSNPGQAALNNYLKERFELFIAHSGATQPPYATFTGYFQAELKGSRNCDERFKFPVYKTPDDLIRVSFGDSANALGIAFAKPRTDRWLRLTNNGSTAIYYTRKEIDREGALHGRFVLLCVDDEIALFFAHIQGSAVITLADGSQTEIGFAARNGHPYVAIGKILIDEQKLLPKQVSMQSIQAYLQGHPEDRSRLLDSNPSYIFFEERSLGPIGSIGQLLTPMRSVALDPSIYPAGMLAFVSTRIPTQIASNANAEESSKQFNALVLNHDSGAAIRGHSRVDLFTGRGSEAAAVAGRLNQAGRLWMLIPRVRF